MRKWEYVREHHIGRAFPKFFGKPWQASNHFGPLQRGDIGKRVYLVRDNADNYSFLQIENETQRDVRLATA